MYHTVCCSVLIWSTDIDTSIIEAHPFVMGIGKALYPEPKLDFINII